MSTTNYNWTHDHPRVHADLNGDGRADVVGFGPDCVWTALNQGSSGFAQPKFATVAFDANSGWREETPRYVTDLTGDGHADIVGFGDDGIWVSLGNGDGTFAPARFVLQNLGYSQGWRVGDHPRYVTDLTGDGHADIIGFGDDGIWVSLGNGDGTFQPVRMVSGDFAHRSGWRVDTPRHVTDLTGDGHADIIGFGDDGIWVSLGNGDGTFAPARFVLQNLGYSQGWRVGDHPRYVTDLTGDGHADIIGFGDDGIWVSLGNGDGTFQPVRMVSGDFAHRSGWRLDTPRHVTDLTGDGHADIIGFGDDGIWVSLGNGDGTFAPARFVLQGLGYNQGWRVNEHPRYLTDLTGDGHADIIGFGDDGVWVSLGNGDGAFQPAQFVLADFGRTSNRDTVVRNERIRDHRNPSRIKHVFVLMLENRSYDHLLGFAELNGTDAATGQPTSADGVIGKYYFNCAAGQRYTVTKGAPDITVAPGHDFEPVLEQLCGQVAKFNHGEPYPEVNNTGYITQLTKRSGGLYADRGAEIMQCFDPDHLVVLTTLAREFAVCDRWFSSMPGPTEPNRMFLSAATSGRFDDSPTPREVVRASTNPFDDFAFEGGTIFDALDRADAKWRIYAGDLFPVVGELDGISNTLDVRDYGDFRGDLQNPNFDAAFIHIEPNYFGSVWETGGDFGHGNSQHPIGGVAAGERLIKATYEAIRNSPHWFNSMLIVTYDEHGGFYDHVVPGPTQPTGSVGRKHGFIFDQLGPRVPAVVISPWIPKGTIEHRLMEHTSVIATLIDLFGVSPLSHAREPGSSLAHLASLTQPRTDTPATLPRVVISGIPAGPTPRVAPDQPLSEDDSLIDAAVRVAAKENIRLEPSRRDEVLSELANVKTRNDAVAFMKKVDGKIAAARSTLQPHVP